MVDTDLPSARPGSRHTVAYLAPEIPALSATFVYEELHGIEQRGLRVVPVSVHRPRQPAQDQAALARRVLVLYQGSPVAGLLRSLGLLPRFGRGLGRALRCLAADLAECGLLRPASWKLVYQFFAAARLAQILRERGCEHLHVHFAHVPTQIAMYASALSGIPFTVTAHANDIFERGLLLRRKAERARRFLTISGHNLAYLRQLGLPEAQLAIVRCGVSFQARPHAPRPADAPFVIGSLGRMVEKKGFDVLIAAVARLRDAGRALQLRLAGDGPLRAELEAEVAARGLQAVVQFDGSLSHDQVAAWMHSLDSFVLACKVDRNGDMDGIPVVLMEAMSQSLPVVSTRLSGIPELVVDGESGLLAAPADAEDLALQIERLIDSPALRRHLGEGACRHVMEEFGMERNLDRLLDAFALPPAAAA